MKNWKYISGAEVGNEAKVTPVDPSPKTGSKPNPDNNQNPKKNPKKEMTDKNGRTFREVLEEVKKTGNARYTSRADVISHLDTDLYDICKKVPAGSPSFAYVRELQKTGWDIGTISKYTKEIGQIIDKYAKVGNSTEKLFYGLKDDAEKEEKKSDEALDELKKTENKKLKFTDKTDSLKEYIYDEETKDGYIYYDGKLVDTKKHVGSGWVDLIKQKAYASGVGNSRTGNKAGNSTYTEADRKRLYELARKHNKTAQEWAEFDELNRKEEKASEELIKRIGKNKTGNYKTGTSKLKPGDKVESYGVKGVVKSIKGENEDNIYGEPLIEVEFNSGVKKVVPEHYLIKVGNASSFIESAKRHMGENKTKADAEYWQYVIDKINKNDPEEKAFIDTAKKELEKTKANLSKIGNSASDDKFAYVMREFDEGKLKTPDGKVVTDPAQAKAIAYSESKKTENGLARARNAMACNKEITLWNGNDTALVKADGTVLYLESNSFETGRDKFDSQELAVKELAKNGYKSK